MVKLLFLFVVVEFMLCVLKIMLQINWFSAIWDSFVTLMHCDVFSLTSGEISIGEYSAKLSQKTQFCLYFNKFNTNFSLHSDLASRAAPIIC